MCDATTPGSPYIQTATPTCPDPTKSIRRVSRHAAEMLLQRWDQQRTPLLSTRLRKKKSHIQGADPSTSNSTDNRRGHKNNNVAIKQGKLSADSGCFYCSTSLVLVVNCTVDQCSNRINEQWRPQGATTEPNVKPKCA